MRRLIGSLLLFVGCLRVVSFAQAQTPDPTITPIPNNSPQQSLDNVGQAGGAEGVFRVPGISLGTFKVSPTGAATYTVPISAPPGTAGMTPNIALVYDSQTENGLLGMGWSLSGLASIHRCPGTVAQDGFKGGINHHGHDRFCLDGRRLVAISGSYGGNGTEYRTEIDTFVKVISYGSAGNGPAYFRLWTKAGEVMEFGATKNSRIKAQGKASARVWALNKIQDTSGNYLTVSYGEDNVNGEYRPVQIDYTGNSGRGLTPDRSVQFLYATRSDATPQFVGGSLIRTTVRLTNVKTYVGATLVRDYRLVYENGGATGRSRLKSLTECDGVGACHSATTFNWQEGGNGTHETVTTPNLPAGWSEDFNGDGKTDLLTSITDSIGSQITVTYKPIADSSVYTKRSNASHPNMDAQDASYVVASHTTSDGLGASYTFNYHYSGAKRHLRGPGRPRFRSMRVVDPGGVQTTTFFKQEFPFTGLLDSSETRSGAGALFLRVTNTWSSTNPHPGVTFVALSRMDGYQCDGQPTCLQTAQSFEYDGFGNPTRTFHHGEVPLLDDERDERTDWSVDTSNWIHRPSHVTLFGSAGGLVRERWLSYDSRGLLTREESRLAGPQGNLGNPVVTHAYNAFGNKTSTTDPRGCTTSTTYDHTQTYPATVTTCLGHTTSFQYDARWGAITSRTDPNNRTATSSYDGFGRLTKVTGPLDTASTYGTLSHEYRDWGTPSLQRIVTFRTEQHGTSNVIWSERYFDGLGRIDQTRQEGPGGQMILTETTFDARGRVATKSAPHFSGEGAVLTQFSYDVLGRQTRVDHPDGIFATTNYVHDVITLTDERGNVKRSFLDAYHRLERLEEVNGNETYRTTYQYDAAGSVIRVTNHLGQVTAMTYDPLGRKIAMQDPKMGSWSYSYDLGGNLINQTDAEGQKLNFDYDLQSRLITKSYPDARQVTWTYDDPLVANSKGRLTRVVDLSATTSFTYDALGSVTQTQRTIDGNTHTMSQSYDALGRVVSETFPDNETVTYSYNEAGWLSSVSAYVASISYNARGQKTQLQYANGVSSTWSYDPNNFRVTRHETNPGASVTDTGPRVALSRWVKSWTTSEIANPPTGYAYLYRGGICVADETGSCVGGDVTAESGVGPVIGYLRTTAATGTVPVYESTCYSNTSGVCIGWGLSLDVNGTAVGYLSTTSPDTQSSSAPLTQSGGILLQGLTGTASAYLWTAQTQTSNHTDHIYTTDGSAPGGYTSEGTTGYLEQNSGAGRVPLYRFVNSGTGHHYTSTTSDQPAGFTQEATLGYLRTSTGTGLAALYRHYNSTTGDYLLNTSPTPPSGYVLQATLGYIHTTAGGSGGPFQNLSYTYDAVGNITAITDTLWTASRSFSYDALNRLTQATGNFALNQSQVTHGYSYNAIGTILEKAGVLYSYGDPNHPSAVTSTSDGKSYSYDANGNMLTGGNRTYAWDADNRLSSSTTGGVSAFMSYDYAGIRVKKDGSGGITAYPFSGYEIAPDGVTTKYIRIGIENVAAKKSTGEVLFYHNDHLGGVNVVTDDAGSRVQLIEYDPWGKVSRDEGIGDSVTRFSGHLLDPESGLYYSGGRYYDPELGRFISPDPFVPHPSDPQSLDRYPYVLNHLLNDIDPDGCFHIVKKKKKKCKLN